jgi:hypothetical protein
MQLCHDCPYPHGCPVTCQQKAGEPPDEPGMCWPSAAAIAEAVRNRKPITLAGVEYVPAQQKIDQLLSDIREAKARHENEPTIWPSSMPTVLSLLERLAIEVKGQH